MHLVTNSQGFIAYTLLLAGYLVAEIRNIFKQDPYLAWINPAVFASLATFMLTFVFTNVLYFMPDNLVSLVGLQPVITAWMNQLMFLVLLAACAMWIGYNSVAGRIISQTLQKSRLLHLCIAPSENINKRAVIVFIIINLIARLWAIKLGWYGYSASTELLSSGANFTEYFNIADWIGKLVLLVVAIHYFSLSYPMVSDRTLLWLMLSYQVVFGLLSGMKSGVVVPFIIVAIAYYCQKNRFPLWVVPAVVASVFAAYTVIEPFRASRNENAHFSGKSLGSIVSTMTNVNKISEFESTKVAPTWLSVLARLNLTYIASLGIEYAANNKLPDDRPHFLRNILLAPAHAIVPRFLWNEKPLQQDGLWYTKRVLGVDVFSATAMSPFTYLNFAGGPLAVILGFLFVGIIQRGLFDGLRSFGTGGLIVFLGLLSTIGTIDNSFNTVIIGIIRYFPMLIVAQYVLMQHPNKSFHEK